MVARGVSGIGDGASYGTSNAGLLEEYLFEMAGPVGRRESIEERWRGLMATIRKGGDADADQFFRSWLIAAHANTVRARPGAARGDYEKIMARFPSWTRENAEMLDLSTDVGIGRFMGPEFGLHARLYARIRAAAPLPISGMRHVYHIHELGVPPQLYYPALMAPAKIGEGLPSAVKKADMVARFLEAFYAYRRACGAEVTLTATRRSIFGIIKEIRGLESKDLAHLLKNKASMMKWPARMKKLRLTASNKPFIRYLLSRITDHVDVMSGKKRGFVKYMSCKGGDPYTIEHVIADKFKRHTGFNDKEEFCLWRRKIGALVLLPDRINKEYSDATYEEKVGGYCRYNLLAGSLNESCYKHARFSRYAEKSGLPFSPYEEFGKAEIDTRQNLYAGLCSQIWGPGAFSDD